LVWAKTDGLSVRSAGTSPRANRTISLKDILWADLIFVMEQKHKARLLASFPQDARYKKIHVLDIPDYYESPQPPVAQLIS